MLDMISRLYYSLRRGGVETIGDILLKSPEEIKGFTQLGVKGYKELTGKLKDVLEKDVYDEWMRR